MEEREDREQPEGERLRESVDESESPVAEGRASADEVAQDAKEKEEQAEEASDEDA